MRDPPRKLTVISGVSGSGKSSLASDTIYAEGSGANVESLSSYARQFWSASRSRTWMRSTAGSGHSHQAEELDAQSALDRGHGHGNLRLHAAAVRALRHGALRLLRRLGQARLDGRSGRDNIAARRGTRLNVLFPVRTPSLNRLRKPGPRRALKSAAKSAAKGPASTPADSPLTEALKARLVELRASGFNRLYQRGRIFEFSTPESLLDLGLHTSSVRSPGPNCCERRKPRAHCGCRGDCIPRGRRGDV